MCVYVCVCMHVGVSVCVHVCVCMHVGVSVCVFKKLNLKRRKVHTLLDLLLQLLLILPLLFQLPPLSLLALTLLRVLLLCIRAERRWGLCV